MRGQKSFFTLLKCQSEFCFPSFYNSKMFNLFGNIFLNYLIYIKIALQALEQVASPSYRSASPLLKEAGTPAPFLPSKKKDLCKYCINVEFPNLINGFTINCNLQHSTFY